jgi:hypothetical protein
MKWWLMGLAMAVMVVMLPVAARAMSTDQFLARANALKARGMMAMLSPDVGVLQGEMATALAGWKADKAARQAAGKPPLDCAQAGDKRLTRDEMLAALGSLTREQRAAPLKDGVAQVMARRYPCR